jgi:hypothetical protein
MARKLRFSERKQVAETGSLGPLRDSPSDQLINALLNVYRRGCESRGGNTFQRSFWDACIEHFGWNGVGPRTFGPNIRGLDTQDFLDFVEIFVEFGKGSYWAAAPVVGEAEGKVNALFERHRFGYRLEGGEIRKIGSPALDVEVVGPALLAVRRPGWEEVERSFREAIQHQRGGSAENDDALTAANAAVEAALKAAGFRGANLGPLTKDFKKSSNIPSELKGVPEALDALIGRSGALRSSYGDSHGKASGSDPVPQALVDLAIHWAAAFIVYVSET